MRLFSIFFLFSALFFCSCSVFEKTAKQELSDGFYVKRSTDKEREKVYVNIEEEMIHVHSTIKDSQHYIVDTISQALLFEPVVKATERIDFNLAQSSFDLDFLTIPLKLRFPVNDIPSQLNTTLNGAVYFGYRTDIYRINYKKNPLKMAERNTNHFGYSVGLFTGFGSTEMTPTNTNDMMQLEYDGVVWSKGIAAILAVNNFTVGLSLGFDNLLDKNKDIWIYQNKPWIGLAFGLNLN